jgi:hypothetical protein
MATLAVAHFCLTVLRCLLLPRRWILCTNCDLGEKKREDIAVLKGAFCLRPVLSIYFLFLIHFLRCAYSDSSQKLVQRNEGGLRTETIIPQRGVPL